MQRIAQHTLYVCSAAVCAVSLSPSVLAQASGGQSVFASGVVAFDDMGQAGGGIFVPNNVLGAPDGVVHSLGIGGSITLSFDVVLTDGPGADLIVSENPFASLSAPWETFAEVVYVEVSTDGVHFARIPSRYTGPQSDPGPFSFVQSGWYQGLGGVFAVQTNPIDAQNLVAAGGDAIDFATLSQDPLVLSGLVDPSFITQVRLVDVRSGLDVDSQGTPIRDPGNGSADIDGVTVVHTAAGLDPNGPSVSIDIPPSGQFVVTIEDPDGWATLDPGTLGVSFWGVPVDPASLFSITVPVQITTTSLTLALPAPLPPLPLPLQMAVALRDGGGAISGAAAVQQ